MKRPMWMVRAAAGGELADAFKSKGIVAIGWNDIGDLRNFRDKAQILSAVQESWSDWSYGRVMNSASQLIRFRDKLSVGDRVITYNSSLRVYYVGTIKGQYRHSHTTLPPYENTRAVKWEGEVDRDKLSVSARNRLGSTLTLFEVPALVAEEIEKILKGHAVTKSNRDEDEIDDEDDLLEQYRLEAMEIIKDRVNQLNWEQVQDLVAGLLRSMGYKTRVSARGPDQGKDILASPDGLGFESPRIAVEVKHQKAKAIGAPDIRSFLGGRHKDDKGLYVSTSGFTKEARYEAERAKIPMMLMDIDELVKTIFRNYDSMDLEAQKLLPLKKIYWPA